MGINSDGTPVTKTLLFVVLALIVGAYAAGIGAYAFVDERIAKVTKTVINHHYSVHQKSTVFVVRPLDPLPRVGWTPTKGAAGDMVQVQGKQFFPASVRFAGEPSVMLSPSEAVMAVNGGKAGFKLSVGQVTDKWFTWTLETSGRATPDTVAWAVQYIAIGRPAVESPSAQEP
ncbi:MAG TPA: hypothetical protein PKE29_03695 [Phycisphaerales bacterium]|nr:hypothetical protein [Phycisphaerales bacterium]